VLIELVQMQHLIAIQFICQMVPVILMRLINVLRCSEQIHALPGQQKIVVINYPLAFLMLLINVEQRFVRIVDALN
jgi:hypothetical protein